MIPVPSRKRIYFFLECVFVLFPHIIDKSAVNGGFSPETANIRVGFLPNYPFLFAVVI